jgi:hypothetical protein
MNLPTLFDPIFSPDRKQRMQNTVCRTIMNDNEMHDTQFFILAADVCERLLSATARCLNTVGTALYANGLL